MRPFAPFALPVLVLAAVSACACPGADAKSVKEAGSITPAAVDSGHYAEAEWDGRIFVFGDAKTEAAFASTHNLQIRRTFIGAGPGGKTVCVEANDKLPAMTDRLVAQFEARWGVSLR